LEPEVRVVIVMGVAAAGKTTVGQALANALGWDFLDADAFHSAASLVKMSAGQGLTDADRGPWLDRLAEWIGERLREEKSAVLACSALRESYRQKLTGGRPEVAVVYLKADPPLLAERLERRAGHFAKRALLESQLATLEEPQDVLTVNAADPPEEIVDTIRRQVGF
jgi:gluconokinase